MSMPTSNFRDLRASFESRSKPTTVTTYPAIAGDLANMALQQPGKRRPSIDRSIDSVLETSPAPPSLRPPLARLRPSWIGPPPSERPQTPGVQAMKQSITVEYSNPGLQPPVYICSNLSDPQWEPIEMHCETRDHEASRFSYSFRVEEGQYQYKFRLGAGDWWVCDETRPTVDDGQGNKNNVLDVKGQPILAVTKPEATATNPNTQARDQLGTVKPPAVVPLPQLSLPLPASATTPKQNGSAEVPVTRKGEETFQTTHGAVDEQTPERETPTLAETDFDDSDEEMHSPTPLDHEQMNGVTGKDTQSDMGDTDSSSDIDYDEEEPGPSTPLLRHETFAKPQAQEAASKNYSSAEAMPPPAKVLVKFPTHHAGIMEMITHTQQRLPADDTMNDYLSDSPESQAVSDRSTPLSSLSQIIEAEEAMLLMIREAEEAEFEKEQANGEELDPLMSGPDSSTSEPEDADFESKTSAPQEIVEIEERIIIEVVDDRKGLVESVLDNVGGRGNTM